MGIFSRLKHIVSANINSLLDQAENPEKTLGLAIKEMEDTLVDEKSKVKRLTEDKTTISENLKIAKKMHKNWEEKAAFAVDKGRDDLARQALEEKHFFVKQIPLLEARDKALTEEVDSIKQGIVDLVEKIADFKERLEMLIERQNSLETRKKIEKDLGNTGKAKGFSSLFEQIEEKLKNWENDSLTSDLTSNSDLENEFDKLAHEKEIDADLETLKKKSSSQENS